MSTGRVVAELGRPETAEETAARKAESSRVYRSSQTLRGLIAAIIATFLVLAVVVLIVPRGDIAPRTEPDVAAIASAASTDTQHQVLTPTTPKDWRVNAARLEQGAKTEWNVIYAPNAESQDRGFLTVAQAFNSTDAFAAQTVTGAKPGAEIEIDGLPWTEFTVSDPSRSQNVSYALGTQAGGDYVLLYGDTSPKVTQAFASSLSEQLRELATTTEGTTP